MTYLEQRSGEKITSATYKPEENRTRIKAGKKLFVLSMQMPVYINETRLVNTNN